MNRKSDYLDFGVSPMTPTRLHIYEVYHAYLARHGEPPSVNVLVKMTGYPRGTVYAVLWRLGLI